MAKYYENCDFCGYSSGPLNYARYGKCPRCGGVSHYTKVEEPGDTTENSSTNDGEGVFWLALIALGYYFVAFPGALLFMLLNQIVEIESGLWSWVLSMVFCLLVFIFSGADIKKYLILDVIILVITGILAEFISSFTPFSFAFDILLPIWK